MKWKTLAASAFLIVMGAIPAASQTGVTGSAASAARPSATLDARVLAALRGARDPVSMGIVAIPHGANDPKRPGPDLTVPKIDLDAKGRIRYTASNPTSAETVNPFVADILVDEVRKDTIKHPPLADFTAHTVTTATLFPDCGTHTIRVLLDPQQIVTETTENNNARSESVTPPCPDLAIMAIKKNWTDANVRFRTQVTVQNLGNLASPAGIVLMVSFDGLGIPDRVFLGLKALQPGESQSFTVGPKYMGTTTVGVMAYVDFYRLLIEKTEANNVTSTTI